MTEPSELVGVVERRLDFLERLAAEPLRKHELVDALGHSRSTVNRAVDELEAAGLVAGETDGYRTTLPGRLLADEYRGVLTVADDLAAAGDVLDPLGAGADVSPAILRDAETYRAAAPDPYRPLEVLDDALADADGVAAALPAFPYPRIAERLRRTAVGGGVVDLALAERAYRHAADRFPDDLGAVARREGCRIASVDAVDVGVVAADGVALLLVFDGDGTLHGAASSTDPEALAWAETRVRDLIGRGRDGGEALAAMDRGAAPATDDRSAAGDSAESDAPGGDAPEASTGGNGDGGALFGPADPGERGRDALSAQGFHAVDGDRLAGDPDPRGPLRATASFPEVDAGYVLDRTAARGGERRSIAGLLVDGLAEGADHALVGPPGSGKSTVCRSVAVEWYRSGRGPVTYRASGGGEAFTATERLRERVAGGDGHHLVVVEDAVDPGAAESVGVARELADRDDVSFLFDAREEPYDDPDGLPLSPADLRYRRRIETVRIPRLDEREVERFVRHVAERTGSAPAADPGSLLADVRRADDERVGELLCLVHRLVRAADGAGAADIDEATRNTPDEDDAGPTSGLETAVAAAVREVESRPPPTADVAVLVNLLNVAGVTDVGTLAYALVDCPERGVSRGDDGDPSPTVEGVRRALDRLTGTALVGSGDGGYRTVHDEWSVLFLERLVEREPDPVVARCVGADRLAGPRARRRPGASRPGPAGGRRRRTDGGSDRTRPERVGGGDGPGGVRRRPALPAARGAVRPRPLRVDRPPGRVPGRPARPPAGVGVADVRRRRRPRRRDRGARRVAAGRRAGGRRAPARVRRRGASPGPVRRGAGPVRACGGALRGRWRPRGTRGGRQGASAGGAFRRRLRDRLRGGVAGVRHRRRGGRPHRDGEGADGRRQRARRARRDRRGAGPLPRRR
ncbi:transcriptional regulator [Halorubrum tebenquichense DSM 14210]|uniref:Transcriptional regulator n=1 Tax=Halorubrum tebenquichense DSM 14210 TaxID=1227485 RepID=M0DR98_9EURY|nr:transcriptional regulator [Halorubrum tebenquichense DSM 14210]